ncbi:MAG TPA: hypothetical protein VFZ61_05460 [Polyangiales bacterium]
MTQLGSLVNLVLGFVVVMAAVSMLVSMVVAMLHRLHNARSRHLAEMLASTIHAFRDHHRDHGTPNDAASAAFVRDVLDDPVLRVGQPAARGAQQARERGARGSIGQDELLALVERKAHGGQLPASWYVELDPRVATYDEFAAWLRKWFPAIEAGATQRFRKESVRLVNVVSALAVVVLNLDAFQLVSDLFSQASLSGTLAEYAPGMAKLPDPGSAEREPSADALGDFVQLNAVLNLPDLKLGWQRSAFVERYCAMRQTCALPPSLTSPTPREDGASFALYVARWLAGLSVSVLLLSLGAPFWADRLRELLLRGAGGQRAASQPPPSAGLSPSQARTTSTT